MVDCLDLLHLGVGRGREEGGEGGEAGRGGGRERKGERGGGRRRVREHLDVHVHKCII